MIKLLKDLLGNGDKIDVNEIAFVDLQDKTKLLGSAIIVESGSNTDGEYMKFGNGWMVCLMSQNITLGQMTQSSNGLWYFTGVENIFYPARFIETPYYARISVIASEEINIANRTMSLSNINPRYYFSADMSNRTLLHKGIAIGRWK